MSLQHCNLERSLIHETKNRKEIGFGSNAEKYSAIDQIDERPFYFYKVGVHERLRQKFSEVEVIRCGLEGNKLSVPGPGVYDVCPCWAKQSGCYISKLNR
jgi:hypothetical protein